MPKSLSCGLKNRMCSTRTTQRPACCTSCDVIGIGVRYGTRIPVERRDLRHVRIIDGEVKDVQILLHALQVAALRQRDDALLDQPTQYDLTRALPVLGGEL